MPEIHFTAGEPGKAGQLTLSGDCTIESAIELKEALAKALDSSSHLVLRIGDVESVDLSFLQMLFWAERTSSKANKKFGLDTGECAAFARTVEQAGLVRSSGSGSQTAWLRAARGSTCSVPVQEGAASVEAAAGAGGSVQ